MKFFFKVTVLVVFLFASQQLLAIDLYNSAEDLITVPDDYLRGIEQYYTTDGTVKALMASRNAARGTRDVLNQKINAVAVVQQKLAAAQIDFGKAKSDRDAARAVSRVELKKLN